MGSTNVNESLQKLEFKNQDLSLKGKKVNSLELTLWSQGRDKLNLMINQKCYSKHLK